MRHQIFFLNTPMCFRKNQLDVCHRQESMETSKVNSKNRPKQSKKIHHHLSHTELVEINRQVEQLIAMGFVRSSSRPSASNMLLGSKTDGSFRICVDYRALTRFTVKNSQPLPRMDMLIDTICHAQYFSTVDLRSGCHQIEISEKGLYNPSFSTRYGHYEYAFVPFGVTNAPVAFMNIMKEFFNDFRNWPVMIYLNGVLVNRNS